MDRCDVLVVRGGPAGSTLAWRLVERGLDVVVLDQARFPRDKVCAGWITPSVVDSLRLDLAEYADGRVLQPIHGFLAGLQDGRQVRTRRAAAPLSYGILRREFDHYLLQRSRARLALGRPLSSLERCGKEWIANDEIASRMVVGAGGHFCPVARRLPTGRVADGPLVAALEVEFEMTPEQATACTVDPTVPELLFCRDLKGYGWVFRKGDHLNIGLGREDPRTLPTHVARFRHSLVDQGKVPPGTPEKFKGHAYRLYTRGRRQVTSDGLLLVGDAAELAYPYSGEGIRPAVESALLAARTIVAAGGDYRRERLAAYDDALAEHFGDRGVGASLIDRLPPPLRIGLGRRLMARPWFVRRVVIERWFLHRHAAGLAATA